MYPLVYTLIQKSTFDDVNSRQDVVVTIKPEGNDEFMNAFFGKVQPPAFFFFCITLELRVGSYTSPEP